MSSRPSKAPPKPASSPRQRPRGGTGSAWQPRRPLVIAESPEKAKTLSACLGEGFDVMAAECPIKDLADTDPGVSAEAAVAIPYELRKGSKRRVQQIRKAAQQAEAVYLATDPGAEGELAASHLAAELEGARPGGGPRLYRVSPQEISPDAVKKAIRVPALLNTRLADSWRARGILERLITLRIAPPLQRHLRRPMPLDLAAVAAMDLIAARERAIAAFTAPDAWAIEVRLQTGARNGINALLADGDGQPRVFADEETARAAVAVLRKAEFQITSVQRTEIAIDPPPPFTTSTLIQDAFDRFGFPAQRTLAAARQLYEGIELAGCGATGLTTFARTESARVREEAAAEARAFIAGRFGDAWLAPPPPAAGRLRADAEAIRPVTAERTPESVENSLDSDQRKLYRLIWQRFTASQMAAARWERATVEIEARGAASPPLRFVATGVTPLFAGFRAVYNSFGNERGRATLGAGSAAPQELAGAQLPCRPKARPTLPPVWGPPNCAADEPPLPAVQLGETLLCSDVAPRRVATEPPARLTDASLVGELEAAGAGRPCSFGTVLSSLEDCGFVSLRGGRIHPTELGLAAAELLAGEFGGIFGIQYAAAFEAELREVEAGRRDWRGVVAGFCDRLRDAGLAPAKDGPPDAPRLPKRDVPLAERCPVCGGKLVIKRGRHGEFTACARFPQCRFVKHTLIGVKCPDCADGELVELQSRLGRAFYGCNHYPNCNFVSWDKPVAGTCPECGSGFLVEKRRRAGRVLACPNEECPFEVPDEMEASRNQPRTA